MSKKVLLVDGSSLAVSLFYALGGADYIDAENLDVEGVELFLRSVAEETIGKVRSRKKFDGFTHVRVALETPPWAPGWRYERLPDYKGALTAPSKPKVAKALQMPLIDACAMLNVKSVFSPGQEADDVIAIMCNTLSEEDEIAIWSRDSDLHQLITRDNIYMIGKGGEKTRKEDVKELWGLPGEAVPVIKSVAGDSSDNIPGVKGIGMKTAAQFIRPAKYRKPNPYVVDLTLVPERFRLQIAQELPRIQRDELICTLVRKGKLLPGESYGEENQTDGEDS